MGLDIKALAAAKKYAKATAQGAGAIQGKPGKDGANGKSAYEIAILNGFIGTEQEWISSLNGKDGETGNGIVSISKESSVGKTDTYKILFTDNTNTTFTVTNATVVNNLSQLNNDTGFITNTVNNLVNYYTKTDTYSKDEISKLLQNIGAGLSVMVVTTLPTENISATTIYLVNEETDNKSYEQWMYIAGQWASLGSTTIDLSAYYNKNDIDNLLIGYITTSSLTIILADYVKKTELASVATTGSYNDLKDLPTIPTTEGYATEQYVDDAISNIHTSDGGSVDLSDYYKKSETYNKAEVDNMIPSITVDSTMSNTSDNPVQNKVITQEVREIVDNLNTHSKDAKIHVTEEERGILNGVTGKSLSYGVFSPATGVIPYGGSQNAITEVKFANQLANNGLEYDTTTSYITLKKNTSYYISLEMRMDGDTNRTYGFGYALKNITDGGTLAYIYGFSYPNDYTTGNWAPVTGQGIARVGDHDIQVCPCICESYNSKGDPVNQTSRLVILEIGNSVKIENKDVYSTDEKVIGTWIDGKPLYRRTFTYGAIPQNGNAIIGVIPDFKLGYICDKGSYYVNQNAQFADLGSYSMLTNTGRNVDVTTYTSYPYITPSGDIVICFGSTAACSEIVVTVEYTKTTD